MDGIIVLNKLIIVIQYAIQTIRLDRLLFFINILLYAFTLLYEYTDRIMLMNKV